MPLLFHSLQLVIASYWLLGLFEELGSSWSSSGTSRFCSSDFLSVFPVAWSLDRGQRLPILHSRPPTLLITPPARLLIGCVDVFTWSLRGSLNWRQKSAAAPGSSVTAERGGGQLQVCRWGRNHDPADVSQNLLQVNGRTEAPRPAQTLRIIALSGALFVCRSGFLLRAELQTVDPRLNAKSAQKQAKIFQKTGLIELQTLFSFKTISWQNQLIS